MNNSGSLARLWAYRARTGLAIVAVAFGVLMIALVSSLIESYRAMLIRGFLDLGASTAIIEAQPLSRNADRLPRPLTGADAEALSRAHLPIRSSLALYSITGQIQACGESITVPILGIVPEYHQMFQLPPVRGRFISHPDVQRAMASAVVGNRLVQRLTCIRRTDQLDISGRPTTVVGVLTPAGNRGGTDMDNAVLLPATTFLKRYGYEFPAARIVVVPTDGQELTAFKTMIEAVLRRRRGFDASEPSDFRVFSPGDVEGASIALSTALKLITGLLLAVSVLVGVLGVLNSVMMGVRERIPEIGLRRTVGATRRNIAIQFLLEGFTIGVVGAAIGSGGGALLAIAIELRYALPLTVDWAVTLGVGVVTILLSAIVSVAPAVHAAMIDPVEALRAE